MPDCLFCKIVAGEIPCAKVYEDNDVLVFLDVMPNTKGHALVIPKKHYENIFDIDDALLGKIMITGKHLALQVKNKLGAVAVNIANNNGKHAGQVIEHFHLHVIPRYEDDGLQMYGPREDVKPSPEELKELAEKLSK